MPTIVEIIEAKRDGRELTSEELRAAVTGFVDGTVPDYQMSALLMAIYLNGMSARETVDLTQQMVASGETIDLSSIPGIHFDKHSTGGIGDKVSLAFVPMIAAAGLPIAKMSGRGLGLTGGTLDKLESIPGFRVNLTVEQILNQVSAIGACICAQTNFIVPADKLIYALRDVTGTVESTPLIASSVMSKKIAGGGDTILLDVKVGRGAFMKDLSKARELALLMQTIGAAHGKKVIVELTSMAIPLGRAVGNLIEVKEIADFLRGEPTEIRLKTLIFDLVQTALDLGESGQKAETIIENGSGWRKFQEIIAWQGGDFSNIDDWDKNCAHTHLYATRDGCIITLNAEAIGRSAMRLGAGRTVKDDDVDPYAGIWIHRTVGEKCIKGELLATVFGAADKMVDDLLETVSDAFGLADFPDVVPPVILERLAATAA